MITPKEYIYQKVREELKPHIEKAHNEFKTNGIKCECIIIDIKDIPEIKCKIGNNPIETHPPRLSISINFMENNRA